MLRVCSTAIIVGLLGGVVSARPSAVETFELAGPPVDFVRIESVSGQAQYRATETSAWQAITVGETLPVGVTVRTGLRSEVVGKMPDGTRIAVGSIMRVALDAEVTSESGVRSSLVITSSDMDERLLRLNGRSMGVSVPQPTLGVQPMLVPPPRGGRDDRFALPMHGTPVGSPRR